MPTTNEILAQDIINGLRERIDELEAKVARVEKVITDLDTQCTNSHAVKMLRKALADEGGPDES